MNNEEIVTSQTPETHPSSCRFCSESSVDFCKKCGQEFCLAHRSHYNSRLCYNCVSDASLAIESNSLIDDEGKEHRGRQLKLIGEGWPNSINALRDMSDEEMEEHIAELTVRVKHAQLTLDYSQILKSAAEFELADRKNSKARAMRSRRENIEKGALRLNGVSQSQTKRQRRHTDPIQVLATSMGIDYATAKQVMAALGKS